MTSEELSDVMSNKRTCETESSEDFQVNLLQLEAVVELF